MEVPKFLEPYTKGDAPTRLTQGLVVGAIATMIIGFGWGGWHLGGTVEEKVEAASTMAMVAALAPICANRFEKASMTNKNLVAALGAVDSWQRDLAPSRELLADFRSGAIDWAEYAERFHGEMASQPASIEALRDARRLADVGLLTLLCWCHDETRCHRTLLRDLTTAQETATP